LLNGVRSAIGRLRHFHGRAEAAARLRPAQPKSRFGCRLLVAYKNGDLLDHQLYSLLKHLRRFADVRTVAFTPEERPRHDPARGARQLEVALEQTRPDVVLVYNNILSVEEVESLHSRGVRLCGFTNGVASFTWGAPPSVTQSDVLGAIRRHARYLVPHAPHVPRLCVEGVNAIEFPLWFDPSWFRPLELRPTCDVLFVGDVTTPLNRNRAALLETLAAAFDVAVMSYVAVPNSTVRHIRPSTNPLVVNRALNQAKLVIGSDQLADTHDLNVYAGQYLYYDDVFFIRQRTYLALGAGACFLVERHPEIERRFVDGDEIVLWDDEDALERQIRELLRDEPARRRIGSNAARRARAEHTTAVRVEQLRQLLLPSA